MVHWIAAVALLAAQEHWPAERGIVEVPTGERIAWYGTLDAARAEAERLDKPLLLLAAAPECQNTPGVW